MNIVKLFTHDHFFLKKKTSFTKYINETIRSKYTPHVNTNNYT